MNDPVCDSRACSRSTLQRVAIVAFAVLQILTPLLPRFGIGQFIGEQSAQTQTIVTPAGWAFSIWGALYTGCLAYAVYQALPSQRHSPLLSRIGWATAGVFLGNAAWAAYTQIFGLTFISATIIFFSLGCILSAYRSIAASPTGFTIGEQWFVVLPLSALAAWLSAAAIVNVVASLEYHGVDGGSETPIIAGAVVVIGGIIASLALWNSRGNPWYAAVFLWALAAIYAAGGQEVALVGAGVIVAAILVVASAAIRLTSEASRSFWFESGRAVLQPR